MALSQIDLTLGAILLGALIGSILYGVATVQLYTYSGRCQKDPMWLFLFVYAIWIAETVITVLSICYIYDLAISNFGNPAHITDVPWTIDAFITLQSIASASVQIFFGYRVYKLSRSLIVPALICLGSLVRISLNATISALSVKTPNIADIGAKYGTLMTLSLAVSAAMDILNVISLTWALASSRGSMDQTSRMVDKLIVYSIETGLITSLAGICILVTRVTMTNNFVWIGLFEFYPKLYSNSLMASLNARAGLRHKYMNDGIHAMSSITQPSVLSGRTERSGVNVQMVSFTETGDPGQKQIQSAEHDGTESERTLTVLPFKSQGIDA